MPTFIKKEAAPVEEMELRTVRVWNDLDKDGEEVEAWCLSSNLCVHESLGYVEDGQRVKDDKWAVTSITTGLAAVRVNDRATAERIARELDKRFRDAFALGSWDNGEAILKAVPYWVKFWMKAIHGSGEWRSPEHYIEHFPAPVVEAPAPKRANQVVTKIVVAPIMKPKRL